MTKELDADIVIVGGGLLGLTAAHYLRDSGAEIIILERGRLGNEASGTNAGTLSVQNKELKLTALTMEAANEWDSLNRVFDGSLAYVRSGGMRIAMTDEESQELLTIAESQRSVGLEVDTLVGNEITDRAPYLSPDVRMANYCSLDGYCNPLDCLPALEHSVRGSANISIFEGVEAESLKEAGNGRWQVGAKGAAYRGDRVILAMGAWTADFLADTAGIAIPRELRVNQLMVSEPVEPFVAHVITNVAETLTLKQVDPGTFLIGGGWQGDGCFGRRRATPSFESMVGNAMTAVDAIPALRHLSIVRAWARFDARSDNKMPICGRLKSMPGVFVNGAGHAGWTYGPLISKKVAGLITGSVMDDELIEYAPERITRAVHS